MYSVISKKSKKKNIIQNIELSGILFGILNKTYKINGVSVINLVIYDKKLAYPIAFKQVQKIFNKLMSVLPDLLISDDDSGESIREALNRIEKFRQIIKNKYRKYLKQRDLEMMSKQLMIVQEEAKRRMLEIHNSKFRNSNVRSSCK